MKRLIFPFALSVLFMMVFASCKNDNNSSPDTSKTLQDGTWKITLYSEDGVDKTYHFTGYSFTFKTDGTITATNGSNTVNGTYSKGNDDSQEKLILSFNTTVPFDELNDDWHVLEKTSTKIRVQDVSGGNGGTDLLTFEKK